MRPYFPLALIALTLAACTPADQQYCNNLGVAGTSEYGACLSYYHKQENLFGTDRAFCDNEADGTYPRSLYDTGHYQPVFVHGGFGPYGNYYGGGISHVYVQPDYYRNSQVDALRNRIVAPCMSARGWNSPDTWQAGRRSMKAKPTKFTSERLPWAR